MIRRLFWLTLGAVLGVSGYRRATRFTRSLSPVAKAAGLAQFAADVRDGMQQYMERHPGETASTLERHPEAGQFTGLPPDRVVSRTHHVKDGR